MDVCCSNRVIEIVQLWTKFQNSMVSFARFVLDFKLKWLQEGLNCKRTYDIVTKPDKPLWNNTQCRSTSTSSQVSKCNGVVLEIYLDQKLQWPQEDLNCKSLAYEVVT